MWLAVLSHGGSVHVDDHNFALWLNRTTGKFHPLLIDVNGYGWSHGEETSERGFVFGKNILELAWLQYPENLKKYVDASYKLLKGIGSEESMSDTISSIWKRIKPDLISDPYLSDMGARWDYTRTLFPTSQLDGNIQSIFSFIRRRNEKVNRLLSQASLYYREEEGLLTFCYEGFSSLKIEQVNGEFETVLPRTVESDRAVAFFTKKGRIDEYTFFHELTGDQILPEKSPLGDSGWREQDVQLFNETKEVDVLEIDNYLELGPGMINVVEDRYYQAHHIVVKPGTTFQIKKGKSIFFEGNLSLLGKSDQMVEFKAQGRDPYGVIACLGKHRFVMVAKYVKVVGGSSAWRGNAYYSGMFSLRQMKNFSISQSLFSENVIGDDTLHIVESRGVLDQCEIKNAAFDAIDWDQVVGRIENCKINNAGNDGIDVSMSNVVMRSNIVTECGDKGISLGEGSLVALQKNEIDSCEIGVAVKDESEVGIWGLNDIRRCSQPVSAYRKKWRWTRGGKVNVFNSSKEVLSRVTTDSESELMGFGDLESLEGDTKWHSLIDELGTL
jgi:hypothetical protein